MTDFSNGVRRFWTVNEGCILRFNNQYLCVNIHFKIQIIKSEFNHVQIESSRRGRSLHILISKVGFYIIILMHLISFQSLFHCTLYNFLLFDISSIGHFCLYAQFLFLILKREPTAAVRLSTHLNIWRTMIR